jgi:hypothetical protein
MNALLELSVFDREIGTATGELCKVCLCIAIHSRIACESSNCTSTCRIVRAFFEGDGGEK